ncbi:hypothetical protein DdX_06153 [Ditylenchus destructor]|uniref:Uncharacterized protein n=1 Tax=Ditylenchus destructor TaxID=166010 RepID=A0AAD4R6C8_9BILA|nr:hypothetical protein DdX_06153 [Ditylenchus destructor]
MATGTENQKSTIILVIWRHLLNLSEFKKPETVKITVVGPSHLVVDESQIDVIHHVEGPITPRDQNHTVLMQKVRELCAALAGTSASTWLCVFERCLQREVAQIREEFDIEGPRPEQFDQLTRRKDIRAVCRRGGLTTLRCCSFGSVQGKPDAWVECANSQVGQYPMFLRPVNAEVNCMHTLCIAQSSEDLKSWIRARPQSSNYCVDYLVEECLENGYEFIAVVSCRTGLIGAFCTMDPKRTLYMSVKSQSGYGIEYLNAEQTRDALPGVESFVMQSMKTVFRYV